jgi:hypothetical protein
MAAAEDAFLETEFMAPVLPDGQVQVRIAGLVCTLRVVGRVEPGWAILKPLSLDRAQVVDRPGLGQIRDYLDLFPALKLLLLSRAGADWLALPAHRGDARFQFTGPARVHLATGVASFQQIVARYDGARFWFEGLDRRRSPAIAAYLHQALQAETPPDALHKPTLTAEERDAYRLVYEALAAAQRDRTEARLAEALAHAGAELSSYIEREDVYTVTYTVDGVPHRSTVRKDDLTVAVAGVCLSGQDRRFDLQSLVGVLREGAQGDGLVRVDDPEGLDPEMYWRIHPPEA